MIGARQLHGSGRCVTDAAPAGFPLVASKLRQKTKERLRSRTKKSSHLPSPPRRKLPHTHTLMANATKKPTAASLTERRLRLVCALGGGRQQHRGELGQRRLLLAAHLVGQPGKGLLLHPGVDVCRGAQRGGRKAGAMKGGGGTWQWSMPLSGGTPPPPLGGGGRLGGGGGMPLSGVYAFLPSGVISISVTSSRTCTHTAGDRAKFWRQACTQPGIE